MSIRISAAAVCAVLLSCLSTGGASAHAVLDVREAPAGSYFKGVIRIGHGCDTSPTVRVTVQIPSGILSVRPQPKAGWSLEIRKKMLPEPVAGPHGKMVTEVVSEVVWSGGPLPDAYFDEFALQMKLPDMTDGGVLTFPVVQDCEQGSRAWDEVPKPGQSRRDLKSPAPVLTLTANPQTHKH